MGGMGGGFGGSGGAGGGAGGGPVLDVGDLGAFNMAETRNFLSAWAMANQGAITSSEISAIFSGNTAGVFLWFRTPVTLTTAIAGMAMTFE
jgi:hypothetical protein